MSAESIQLWSLVGQWAAAVGTLAAVITALYLARRDEQVRLSVKANMVRGIILAPIPLPDEASTIQVEVTNVGRRNVVITGISWRFGLFKPQDFSALMHEHSYSDPLPKKLEDGDYASFYMTESKFRNNKELLTTHIPSHWVTLTPWWIRIGARTSSGDVIWGRVAKPLRAWILNEFSSDRDTNNSV